MARLTVEETDIPETRGLSVGTLVTWNGRSARVVRVFRQRCEAFSSADGDKIELDVGGAIVRTDPGMDPALVLP